MISSQTSPAIQTTILTRLSQWATLQPLTPLPNIPDTLMSALQSQDEIGWDNFFEGCTAKAWEEHQQAYYDWCRTQKSSRRWAIALIQKLWDIAWDLWEHRIGIVHSQENAETLHNMASVDSNIRSQFLQGPQGLRQHDHSLFSGHMDDILSNTILFRQRWLQWVETARARAARHNAITFSRE
jgi:hypothetical protein